MGRRRTTSYEGHPYNREGNRKARRKAKADRIQTMAMMLGAKWVGETWTDGYFEKRSDGVASGHPVNWTTYYDTNGNEIS